MRLYFIQKRMVAYLTMVNLYKKKKKIEKDWGGRRLNALVTFIYISIFPQSELHWFAETV